MSEAKTMEPKAKKPVSTWMLHCPKTMASVGKYNSASHRNAALKAATKGFTTIWLRPTNTKKIYVYEGSVTPVETKMISRGDRVIPYSKKPCAKFVETFEYTGNQLLEDDKPNGKSESAQAEGEAEKAEPSGTEPESNDKENVDPVAGAIPAKPKRAVKRTPKAPAEGDEKPKRAPRKRAVE